MKNLDGQESEYRFAVIAKEARTISMRFIRLNSESIICTYNKESINFIDSLYQ
jgi:hypothetical protein